MREELHFHTLRHTFASWLVEDGDSLYQIGRLYDGRASSGPHRASAASCASYHGWIGC